MRRAVAAWSAVVILLGACGGAPEPEAPPGRVVRFTTDDGVRLTGELRGRGTTGVILSHMFPTDRASWAAFADVLADEGYLALTFDFRGYGDSEGERAIPDIWRDVLAAIEFLRGRGAGRVVLIGASMGGTASLVAAAREDVAGVVSLSGASTFMGLLAPPEALRAITEPKLFVAAEGDGSAAGTAQQFYANSPPPKRVEIVTGDDHGTDLLTGTQGERVRAFIVGFLRQYA
ncbi:MAG TPA: alpha/beta fold hydrolase [Actinomycetota bacterium]|nr:alpha/beta fold hydrolase [Actinomycetota bacterium]